MGSRRQIYRQNSHSAKIQDGGGCHIENHIFGHNSAIIAHIRTEYDIHGHRKGSGRQSSYENSDVPKSKMALVAFAIS